MQTMSACFLLIPDKSGMVVLILHRQIAKDSPKARIDKQTQKSDMKQIIASINAQNISKIIVAVKLDYIYRRLKTSFSMLDILKYDFDNLDKLHRFGREVEGTELAGLYRHNIGDKVLDPQSVSDIRVAIIDTFHQVQEILLALQGGTPPSHEFDYSKIKLIYDSDTEGVFLSFVGLKGYFFLGYSIVAEVTFI